MSVSKSTPKRVFTEEFKREAVRLVNERGNICAVARDLGVHESILGRWKRAVQKESQPSPAPVESRSLPAFPGKGNPRDEEMVQLQRENRRLKEENEILKKAVGIFTSRPA
jgi:transposase